MIRYERIRCIGRGHYGSAWLVREKESSSLFVIKYISMEFLSSKEKWQTEQEVQLLSSLKHPHIVRYREEYVKDNVLHLVMEYCQGGDLAARVKERRESNQPFKEKVILSWLRQIAEGLHYLHKRRVLHRDLKCSNIFLSRAGERERDTDDEREEERERREKDDEVEETVKIGDFGIARVLKSTIDQARTVVGTPHYLSPEVCESRPYSFSSDIWALGCVLYELLTLRRAFEADNLLRLVYMIVKEEPPPLPSFYSEELREMVLWMLKKKPEERPSAQEILETELLKDILPGFVHAPTFSPISPRIAHTGNPTAREREREGEERENYRRDTGEERDVPLPYNPSRAWPPRPFWDRAHCVSSEEEEEDGEERERERRDRKCGRHLSLSLWAEASQEGEETADSSGPRPLPIEILPDRDGEGPGEKKPLFSLSLSSFAFSPASHVMSLLGHSTSLSFSRPEDEFERDSLAYSEDFHSEGDEAG